MKKVFIIISLSFLFCFILGGQDFGTSIKDDAYSLWNQNPDTFKTSFGPAEMYKWKSALKNVLVYKSKDAETKLLFFEQEIAKAEFKFKSKQLQSISLHLVKSGDLSNTEAYLEHIKTINEQIAGLCKVSKPKVRKRKTRSGYRYTYSWKSPEYYLSLKCSYAIKEKKTFKPGNIIVSIFRRVAVESLNNYEKKSSEDEEIGEEGAKSAIAAKAPVADKDEHKLVLKMFKETSPEDSLYACVRSIFNYYKVTPKGRSWKKVKKSLELDAKSAKGFKHIYSSIIGECRCDVKQLATTKIFDNSNNIRGFLREYNEEAAKAKKGTINSFKIKTFPQLVKVLDEEILMKVRNDPKKIADFKAKVCKEIDAEKPVLWIVLLGAIQEIPEPAKPAGGHVRLIIGYNKKTDEVIYADTWGKGHELKKMAWDKAWAMTLSVLDITIKK